MYQARARCTKGCKFSTLVIGYGALGSAISCWAAPYQKDGGGYSPVRRTAQQFANATNEQSTFTVANDRPHPGPSTPKSRPLFGPTPPALLRPSTGWQYISDLLESVRWGGSVQGITLKQGRGQAPHCTVANKVCLNQLNQIRNRALQVPTLSGRPSLRTLCTWRLCGNPLGLPNLQFLHEPTRTISIWKGTDR